MTSFLHLSIEQAEGREGESRSALKVGDQIKKMNPGQQKTLIH